MTEHQKQDLYDRETFLRDVIASDYLNPLDLFRIAFAFSLGLISRADGDSDFFSDNTWVLIIEPEEWSLGNKLMPDLRNDTIRQAIDREIMRFAKIHGDDKT